MKFFVVLGQHSAAFPLKLTSTKFISQHSPSTTLITSSVKPYNLQAGWSISSRCGLSLRKAGFRALRGVIMVNNLLLCVNAYVLRMLIRSRLI